MKEIFYKHKVVIFRLLGAFMLFVGMVAYFWSAPKEVMSENEIAAANIARMEASVRGGGATAKHKEESSSSKFVEELKNTQEAQMQYLTMITMIFGALFLGYSFLPKNDSEK
ncbi:MAG: hypothetical protein PHX44_03625 [Sulfurimonas sp.]|uniref:hypothetical protein n=1 Tax=Sulfurimonas sp. TaxID=2022749 RepID=UPI00260D511B|nr:hypothetical protein [Sulfurimonas sp.]MDD2652119.1 hypothetical protein [Sulfurimonas sp.]MDD3451971.1 hypothetical protein [Sulfurimonas sp.]